MIAINDVPPRHFPGCIERAYVWHSEPASASGSSGKMVGCVRLARFLIGERASDITASALKIFSISPERGAWSTGFQGIVLFTQQRKQFRRGRIRWCQHPGMLTQMDNVPVWAV